MLLTLALDPVSQYRNLKYSQYNPVTEDHSIAMGFLSQSHPFAVDEAAKYRPAPPRGSPYSIPLPGSKKEGRSEVYRHWRFKDELLTTLDPSVCKVLQLWRNTWLIQCLDWDIARVLPEFWCVYRSSWQIAHNGNNPTANNFPSRRCLGYRPWDPATKTFGQYQWLDYATVQKRRAAFGRALVELHRSAGVVGRQYGVGLWCQNRPEWQITGKLEAVVIFKDMY